MSLIAWLPPAVSALLWLGAARLGRALPPATAVRLLTAAVLTVSLATGFVLAVAGFEVLAQVPPVARLGHWSAAVVHSGALLPAAAGTLAGLTVAALLTAAVRRAAVAARDLVLAAMVCRRLRPLVDGLVVVEDGTPDAYALPGIRGRVVVSTAMLRALPADERRVLLAHEAAHLRGHHHAYVQVAELAAAANPLLRPASRAIGLGVERWADEVAAAEVGDRQLAARALARAGLARATARRAGVAHAAALGAVDGQIVERARALLAAPPAPRRVLVAAVSVIVLASAAAAGVTGQHTEQRFDLAQLVYSPPP